MNLRIIALFLLAFFCVSCTATLNRRRPYGENVRLIQRSSMQSQKVELLAVNDSMVYYLNHDTVSSQNWNRIQRVRVLAYETHNTVRWLCWIPTLVLGIGLTAGAEGGDVPVAIVVTALTGLVMYVTAPRSTFSSPPSVEGLEYLSLFARYPRGLNDKQWQALLQAHGQKGFAQRP